MLLPVPGIVAEWMAFQPVARLCLFGQHPATLVRLLPYGPLRLVAAGADMLGQSANAEPLFYDQACLSVDKKFTFSTYNVYS